jgi:hypothetical protein
VTWGWLKVIAMNRGPIFRVVKECFTKWPGKPGRRVDPDFNRGDRPTEIAVALDEQT